jgi:hypothetical protein
MEANQSYRWIYCYKATAIKAASATDFRNFRPERRRKLIKESETPTAEKPTLDAIELPKETITPGTRQKFLLVKVQKDSLPGLI